jgi:hypothetical protein
MRLVEQIIDVHAGDNILAKRERRLEIVYMKAVELMRRVQRLSPGRVRRGIPET